MSKLFPLMTSYTKDMFTQRLTRSVSGRDLVSRIPHFHDVLIKK